MTSFGGMIWSGNGTASMKSKTIAERKRIGRRQLAALPFDRKLKALIVLQQTAVDMAAAAGRPFHGVVWRLSRRPPARGAPPGGS